MGTQQVQRRGWKLKGNLRKQPGAGRPSQTLGPAPSSPFSDPARHKHTSACFPGPARPAWTRRRGHRPGQAERTGQGRNQVSNPRTECARRSPHPQRAHTHRAPTGKQTFDYDKTSVTGHRGWMDGPTPPLCRLGAETGRLYHHMTG